MWILSEEGDREKTCFSEKANVRNTLAGCSRMRVGKGSPKKKEIDQIRTIYKKLKIGTETVMEHV